MTRAEAAKVFANLFKLETKADLSDYTDVGLGKWYDDPIAKCINAGIMEGYGDGIINPTGTITREMFFVMFCRALGIKPVDTTEININDASNVSNYAKGYITALINKGYISGTTETENGITVAPKLNINRASVMSLMDQTITTYVNTTEKVTAKDGLTLIVVDNANVTFANNTKDAEVYVFGKNTAITNAPVGTKVITSENASGVNVNGKSFSKDTTTIVEKPTPSGGGSYTPPAPTTYTVTFDMQGHGTQIATYTNISYGLKIAAPTAPTATGYVFKGWYKEAECTNAWNFDTDTVASDITLFAKWAEGKTIAEILATVSGGFPTMEANVWTDGMDSVCYNNGGVLSFYKEGCGNPFIPGSYVAEKVDDNYVIALSSYTATFVMSGDKLTQIIFNGIEGMAGLTGTYTAPTTFKAVAVKDANGKYDLTFYYDNKTYSGTNVTVYDNLPTSATNTNIWGYDGIRSNVKSVVIDRSVKNYNGLTSTAYMFANIPNADSISGAEYLDVSNVTDMSYMFDGYGTSSAALNFTLDLSGWSVASVATYTDMFNEAGAEATSWNVIIPAKTGNQPNEANKWYVGNGTDASKYIEPASGKTFTLPPAGALSGVFSVSATKKVHFSQGNLWYGKVGDAQTATFQFESNQYEFHGYDSANNTWGLFGWVGASSTTFTSSPKIYGVSTSQTDSDYGNVAVEALKADWGTAIDDKGTWRTLTTAEWQYLINKDGDENIRKGKYKYGVTVCEKTNCLILAPDDFEGSIAASYDAAAWETAEAAGLVCLPAAGYRKGSILNFVGNNGYYWSSNDVNSNHAYCVSLSSSNVNPGNEGLCSNGCSVRLVTEVK